MIDWRKEEPMCWWTDEEIKVCQQAIVKIGPRRGWFGRWYMDYYCPPWANIYGEPFAWSDRCAAPIERKDGTN